MPVLRAQAAKALSKYRTEALVAAPRSEQAVRKIWTMQRLRNFIAARFRHRDRCSFIVTELAEARPQLRKEWKESDYIRGSIKVKFMEGAPVVTAGCARTTRINFIQNQTHHQDRATRTTTTTSLFAPRLPR